MMNKGRSSDVCIRRPRRVRSPRRIPSTMCAYRRRCRPVMVRIHDAGDPLKRALPRGAASPSPVECRPANQRLRSSWPAAIRALSGRSPAVSNRHQIQRFRCSAHGTFRACPRATDDANPGPRGPDWALGAPEAHRGENGRQRVRADPAGAEIWRHPYAEGMAWMTDNTTTVEALTAEVRALLVGPPTWTGHR